MKARFRRILGAAVIAALLLAAAPMNAGAAPALAGEPVPLNAIIPQTGTGAFLGKSYLEAFHALETLINSTGGIQGRPLKIVTADTQTNGAIDVQLVNGLIAAHTQVFIDGAPSTVCLPSIPLVEKSGPVDYCLSPAVHPPSGGYVFTVNGSTADLTTVDLRYFRLRGWQKIAVMVSTDSNGLDYERTIPTIVNLPENHDLHVVALEHFNNTDIGVTAQVARVKASGADVVMVLTTGTALGTVLRGLHDAGMTLPVLTINPNMTFAQMDAYANFMPKELYFGTLRAMTPKDTLPGPLHEAQAVFVRAMRKVGIEPDGGHANCWDAAMIIVDTLRHVGPAATAEQIRDYILHLHGWLGANGVYDFTHGSTSGIGQNSIIIARWVPEKRYWTQVSRPGGLLR